MYCERHPIQPAYLPFDSCHIEDVLLWFVNLDSVQQWPFCQWGSWRSPASVLLALLRFLSPSPGAHWIKHTTHTHTHFNDFTIITKLFWVIQKQKVSPKVILHLREELWELPADFLSDSCLHKHVLCPLLLQLELYLSQQCHLPLRKNTPHWRGFNLKVVGFVIMLNVSHIITNSNYCQ